MPRRLTTAPKLLDLHTEIIRLTSNRSLSNENDEELRNVATEVVRNSTLISRGVKDLKDWEWSDFNSLRETLITSVRSNYPKLHAMIEELIQSEEREPRQQFKSQRGNRTGLSRLSSQRGKNRAKRSTGYRVGIRPRGYRTCTQSRLIRGSYNSTST